MGVIEQSEGLDSTFVVGERAVDIVEEARQTFSHLKSEAYEKAAAADTFVRTRPYAAVGLAVLAGLVVARLLSAGRPQVIYLRERHRAPH